jgi:Spy/CpxP family protein refolding chaperone
MNWKELKVISAAGALSMAMLATCAAQSAPAQAQTTNQTPSATTPDGKAPAMGKTHAKGMHGMDNLNLTDEQKAKIKPIRAKEWEQMKAVKSDTTLTDAQKKEKIHSIRRDSNKQISGVLTPEQRQQWKENKKQHHEKAKAKAQKQQPS